MKGDILLPVMLRKYFSILFYCYLTGMSYAADGVANIISYEGDVIHLNDESIEQDLQVGGKVKVRHSLATLSNGRILIQLPDDSKLSLEPESELLIENLIDKTSRGFQGTSRFILLKGAILADVTKRFREHTSLEISTDKEISFWVKGTYFYTFIDPGTSHVWTLVKGGTVQAVDFQHDDHQSIGQGESMVVLEGKYLTKSLPYDWAKRLGWKGAIENNFLFTNKIQTANLRKMEVEKQIGELRSRNTKPFIEEISTKYNEQGREREQFGEAILTEIPFHVRETESVIAFDGGESPLAAAPVPTPVAILEPVKQATIPENKDENKDENREKIKLEVARIRTSNICRWATMQGFSCKTDKECSSDTPYTLGNIIDQNDLKICLGCNMGSFGNDCFIKPMKCGTYSDVYLESGVLIYRGKMAYRCIDLLPINISKLQ